jgi:hypothetical protein
MQNSRSYNQKYIHVYGKWSSVTVLKMYTDSYYEPDKSREKLNIILLLKSSSHLFLDLPSALFQ